jgi:hypothetical protein
MSDDDFYDEDGVFTQEQLSFFAHIHKNSKKVLRGRPKTFSDKIRTTTVRFPTHVMAELEAAAASETRTVNNLIFFIVNEYLKSKKLARLTAPLRTK